MMQSSDALQMIFSRNAFYRRLHFLILGVFVLCLLVIGILIGIIIYLIKNPTLPLYFATDSIGRLIKIIPIDRPNMTDDEVTAWVIDAIQTTLSYDYVNFRSQLQSSQRFFTDYGWSYYMKALASSGNLLALQQDRQIVITQLFKTPNITVRGLLAGAYSWKFQMPEILVTYWKPPYDAKSKFSNALQGSVIVQRQPILQSYKGLGIVQLILLSPVATQPQEISGTAPG
jgi:intracellular multiplication protein IcmL